ncbi:hypothetical protein PH5382_01269 [Phaeobacter sp. CECT 5382]|nr:hypothetical protein PH5382_01269 [Phaeobacter sp. CECT 5382]
MLWSQSQNGHMPRPLQSRSCPKPVLRTCPGRAGKVEAGIEIGQPMGSFMNHDFTLNPQQKSWAARATDEARMLARAILQKWL